MLRWDRNTRSGQQFATLSGATEELRAAYLDALRAADAGDLRQLLAFARS